MILGRVGASLVALAVASAVFLVAPARVDSWDAGFERNCIAMSRFYNVQERCQSRIDTDLTWAWALGNKVRADAFGQIEYRVHQLDMAADAIVAGVFGGLTLFALTNNWHGRKNATQKKPGGKR